MPNVEIHGLSSCAARELGVRIFEKFQNTPFVDDLVVTIFPTEVFDSNGKVQPFLRLANTCQDGTPLIIQALQDLGLDVEHVKLEGFYPKNVSSGGEAHPEEDDGGGE